VKKVIERCPLSVVGKTAIIKKFYLYTQGLFFPSYEQLTKKGFYGMYPIVGQNILFVPRKI